MKKQALKSRIANLEATLNDQSHTVRQQAARIRDLQAKLREAETPPTCEVEESGNTFGRVVAGLFVGGCAALAAYCGWRAW